MSDPLVTALLNVVRAAETAERNHYIALLAAPLPITKRDIEHASLCDLFCTDHDHQCGRAA
jgi:hypothetical protein